MANNFTFAAPYFVGDNDSVTVNIGEETVKLNKNFTLNSKKYIKQITSSVSDLFNSLSTDTVENVQIEMAKNSTEIVTADDISFVNTQGEVVDHYELNFAYQSENGLYKATLEWGINYQGNYWGYINFFKQSAYEIHTLFTSRNNSSSGTYTSKIDIWSTYPNEPSPNNNFSARFLFIFPVNSYDKTINLTIKYPT